MLWVAISTSLFLLWRLKLMRSDIQEQSGGTSYFLSRLTRMMARKEYEHLITRLRKWLKEAQWSITPEVYVIVNMLGIMLSIGGYITHLDGLMSVGVLTVIPLNSLLYSKIKRFRDQLRQELGEVQELFLVQLQMGTALDILFSYAADMVEKPLKTVFERIAMAISTRQDTRAEIIRLREMTDQIEVVTFSFILERYLDSGVGQQSIEALGKSVEQYRVYRREMDRRANMAKLVVAAVLMIGSVSLITLVPNMLETIRTIYNTFQ